MRSKKKGLGKFWRYLFKTRDIDKTMQMFAVLGFQSRVGRNKHIILLDYDKYSITKIRSEINSVRKEFPHLFMPFYIVSTSVKKYAVLSFNIVSFKIFKRILRICKGVDRKFKKVTLNNMQATLRFTRKNYLIFSIPRIHMMIGEKQENALSRRAFQLMGFENWKGIRQYG